MGEKHWVKQVGFEVKAVNEGHGSVYYPKARNVRVMQVVASAQLEGEGEPDNPYREVVYYYSLEGTPLARHDLWELTPPTPSKEGKKNADA